jgi:hypothetical protein
METLALHMIWLDDYLVLSSGWMITFVVIFWMYDNTDVIIWLYNNILLIIWYYSIIWLDDKIDVII